MQLVPFLLFSLLPLRKPETATARDLKVCCLDGNLFADWISVVPRLSTEEEEKKDSLR